MSNRSLSAPDFVTSNMRRMQLRHFWEVCHEFLLSALPVLTSKLRLMKALMEPDLWWLTQRGYICMPSWLTVTCVFVLESLLEEPAASRFCNGRDWYQDVPRQWISRQNEGDIRGLWFGLMYVYVCSIDEKGKQSMYHTVSLHMCLCHSWFQYIFSEVRHFYLDVFNFNIVN